jgi:two-component system, NtrC family, response regulator AtoC
MTEQYVLVVDDDPAFSQFTRNLLTDKAMRVVVATSKAEGLGAFERERPSCVILDIFLPDGSGVDLIKPMRAASLTIPIIMVSGQSDVDEVVRAMKEGASDYVKKPFQGEELLLKMQMVLDASHAKVELDELRIKARPEEEYNLLFGMSDRMSKVQAVLDQVANTDITVLITGESGTGKELVAKAVHKASDRANDPFIKVNCAALPRELLESELFGFEKGAFTGAHRRKYGRFEMAQSGTIFLDEISEMHLDLQSKLLHVLQEKQFFRIGGEREVKANCRILCATNKNLERMVEEGGFRRDLFYRVNVVNIVVPPLRERKEDIPLIADYFLDRYTRMYNREAMKLPAKLVELFLDYSWPGNVRELENNVKRFIILGNQAQLIAEFQRKQETGQYSAVPNDSQGVDPGGGGPRPGSARRIPPKEQATIPGGNGGEPAGGQVAEKATLKEVGKIAQRIAEKILIEQVLYQTRWNRRKAARILDISYKALLYKIKECGLTME